MRYQTDIRKQTITIEGVTFDKNYFSANNLYDNKLPKYKKDLFLFLQDWFSESSLIKVQTSGSTGDPKIMYVEKERMINSACLTCSFLNLQKGDKALLCMSLDYIAGKMMVVRALIAGLDLYPIDPSGNPLTNTSIPFDFVAMVPLQVYNSLRIESEKEKLQQIKNLIIGGDAINKHLEEELKSFPNKVFSTYGMTETLSHIALRQLNGINSSEYYKPFSSIHLLLHENNTLIIDAPLLTKDKLFTNDVVELLPDMTFRIIGRVNNIINSGGIKIQIEEIEKLLKSVILCPFAITSFPDSKFGEIIVLVVQEEIRENLIKNQLPLYYYPKRILKIDSIPLTETGKINRSLLKEKVRLILSKL